MYVCKVKKTFWLREFACLLKGEHGDVSHAVQVLQSNGHLTVHLINQLMRMYIYLYSPNKVAMYINEQINKQT